MEVVFILLPLALAVAGIMLALFIWAVRSGQYDDLETPAVRMLLDDAAPATSPGRMRSETPPAAGAARRETAAGGLPQQRRETAQPAPGARSETAPRARGAAGGDAAGGSAGAPLARTAQSQPTDPTHADEK